MIEEHGQFDIILVDGLTTTRLPSAIAGYQQLKDGGMIIVDNSDQSLQTTAYLRTKGLIQIDFTGFGPVALHPTTTSFFLTRNFNFSPRNAVQPIPSVAQPLKPWPEA